MGSEGQKFDLNISQWHQALERTGHFNKEAIKELGNPDDIKDPTKKFRLQEQIRAEVIKIKHMTMEQIQQSVKALFLGEGEPVSLNELRDVDGSHSDFNDRYGLSVEEVVKAVSLDREKGYALIVSMTDQLKNRVSQLTTWAYVLTKKVDPVIVEQMITQLKSITPDYRFMREAQTRLIEHDETSSEVNDNLTNAFNEIHSHFDKITQRLQNQEQAIGILEQLNRIQV